MKRRFVITAMALWMAVALTACGEKAIKEDVVASQESIKEDSGESDAAPKETEVSKEEEIIQESKEEDVASDLERDDKEEPLITPEENSNRLAEYYALPESKGFVFESNGDGTCTLVEIGTCEDELVVIPKKSPNGDTVTMIAEYAFYDAEDITEIVIVDKQLKVDDKAFQNCEFDKLVIGDCELEIGENAFEYCRDVKEIILINSNLEIGTYAFYDSGKKAKVEIINCAGNIKDKAFQTASISTLTISDSTLSIGENAFEYIDDLELLWVEGCDVDIATYAFYDSGDDMQVVLVNNVMDMDDKAFQSCNAVSLKIQGKDIELSEQAFEYSKELTDVVIEGENAIDVGTYAFYGCESLTNLSIGADTENAERKIVIDDMAFQSCAVAKVTIGSGDVEIGKDAFSNCDNLGTVEIKGKSLNVGKYAFYGCPEELAITYNGSTYNKDNIDNVK